MRRSRLVGLDSMRKVREDRSEEVEREQPKRSEIVSTQKRKRFNAENTEVPRQGRGKTPDTERRKKKEGFLGRKIRGPGMTEFSRRHSRAAWLTASLWRLQRGGA